MPAIETANELINLFDPPKDLAVGGHLNEATHGGRLRTYISDLFLIGSNLPGGWHSVGDHKSKIVNQIGAFFGTSNAITRPKYSTGVDSRPTGLYVLQDNGPNNVVVDGTFLITPGSILDPSEKTKQGVATFNTINDIGGVANTLPMEYINSLAMEKAVIEPITASFNAYNGYTITIPTQMGIITTNFNANFQPSGVNAAYFRGNQTKNQFIAANIEDANEVKKYILVKELGDTLEVQWLNHIFSIPGVPPNRQNTVVITTDTVVKYRAVVNSVGVIHTLKDKSFWILPGGDAAKTAANLAFIQTQIANLQRTNNAVIQVLEDVVASGRSITGENGAWIDGLDWNRTQRTNAIEILNNRIEKLKIFTSDLIVRLRSITDPQQVTEICSKAHCINPFVQKRDGTWHRIKSVNYLVQGVFLYSIPFKNAFFLPRLFNDLADARKNVLGESVQAGGAFDFKLLSDLFREHTAVSIFVLLAAVMLVILMYNQRRLPYTMHVIRKALQATQEVPGFTYRNPPQRNTFINDRAIASKMASLLTNPDDGNLWYLYVRDYHPEIFTYATHMKEAFHLHNLHQGEWPNLDLEFSNKYYKIEDTHYNWANNDNGIILTTTVRYYTSDLAIMLNTTKEAIKLARTYVQIWTTFQSQDLMFFLNFMNSFQGSQSGDYIRDANKLPLREHGAWVQEGGGYASSPAETALDLYTIHHALLVQSNEDLSIPYENLIVERLQFISGYVEYLKENPDDEIMKRQLNFLLEELGSLEIVQNQIPMVKAFIEKVSSSFVPKILNNLDNPQELKNLMIQELTSITQEENEKQANFEKAPALVSAYGGASKRKTKKKSKSKQKRVNRKTKHNKNKYIH